MVTAYKESLAGGSVINFDSQLVERLKRRDEKAFEQLFTRYYSKVYQIIYRLVGNHHEAEDLAQDTFLSLYHHPPRLDPEASLGSWLYRVALNKGYNAIRGSQREQQRIERAAQDDKTVNPEEEAIRSEQQVKIQEALARLPERQVKLLLLRQEGCSYAEIAETLDLSPGSIGTFLVRAERAFALAYEHISTIELKSSQNVRRSL